MNDNDTAIAIPEWTAEDYQATTPFEWLYQYRDNKFLMMQLCNRIKASANACGVKNFMALWKAYLETIQAQQGLVVDNATQFSGQPIELLCGTYFCDDSGVTMIDRFGFEVVVCTHPIMPVQRLVNIDTGEVKIELAYKRGNTWRLIIFDKSVLASSQKIIELARYGIAVDSENARDMVKYLSSVESLNYDKLGETSSVGRLGWINGDGFSPYVDDIRFDGDLTCRAMFRAVSSSGDYDKWLECASAVRKGGTVARIALSASFASVLVEPCNSLSFLLHLWGGSEAGKAQPLDTKIITPDGYKLMGEIAVGDSVIGDDGKAHKVIGVFPQGEKDVYEITLADGRKTRCCKEHLWNVTTRTRRNHKRGYTIMSLEEMLERPIKGKKGYTYCIPLCSPVEHENGQKLPIDPYLMGALIGDGCLTLTPNKANGSESICFNNSEFDVIGRVINKLNNIGATMRFNPSTTNQFVITRCNGLKDSVKRLGLNVKSPDRFIPEAYKLASANDRKMLLAGLIDTDGHVSGRGAISLCSHSKRLAEDVLELAHGLGYKAALSADNRGAYKVAITSDGDVFLSRKHSQRMNLAKAKRARAEDTSAIAITDVRLVGREQCQCIMVDSEAHTYLCDDYIVTHNTVGLMLAASVWANPAMGAYVKSFNSTNVGLEMYAGFCNSLPLCIDELQVIKNRKTFDDTIYMLAEGVGRNRGAKSGGLQKLQTWSNCTITTGEMPISNGSSGGGAVNRVIEIDCKDEKLFADPRGVVDVIRQNYGFAGREFVEQLRQGSTIELARNMQREIAAELQHGESTEKQAMAGSLILTADALIDLLIFKDGHALTAADLSQFLASKGDVDQNVRAYDWLVDFVATNPSRFTTNEFGTYSGECWGSVESGVAYINKSVFDVKMSEAGFNPTAFLSWAKRKNLIDGASGRTTKLKRIRGLQNPMRCVALTLLNDSADDENLATPFDI